MNFQRKAPLQIENQKESTAVRGRSVRSEREFLLSVPGEIYLLKFIEEVLEGTKNWEDCKKISTGLKFFNGCRLKVSARLFSVF